MPNNSLISDQLRAAILAAPFSQYQLAANARCQRSTLSRFLIGGNLSTETVDRLAEQLGLRLVQTRRVRRTVPPKEERFP